MEPITLLTTAIVAGAVAAAQESTAQAVKDAYAGLKALIASRFQTAKTAIDVIEAKPQDAELKKSAETLIQMSGAEKDVEVLEQAQSVLKAVEKFAPQLAPTIGVKLEEIIVGASMTIRNIKSSGSGVQATRVKVEKDFTIEGVEAGVQHNDPNA